MLPRFGGVGVLRVEHGLAGGMPVVKMESAPVGRRNPDGAGAERRIGGQTARQSTTPCRKVGRCACCVPQLRCGVEHDASLRIRSHAA